MSSVVIRKFEPADQAAVSDMYRSGMKIYSEMDNASLASCTSWFVNNKLQEGGDMSDIQKYFMDDPKRCFWVAVLNNKIVGCVGAYPSTKYDDKEYVELVRMSVSSDARNQGVGAKFIKVLNDWGKLQGYSKIYLSTLNEMHLAVALYTKNRFILKEQEAYDVSGMVGFPCVMTGNHYVRDIE